MKYPELKELADNNNVYFKIEGTVVAGTPVINLAEGPLAGCEISKIRGILNAIISDFEIFRQLHPAYKTMTKQTILEGLGAPLHKAAREYFIEKKILKK